MMFLSKKKFRVLSHSESISSLNALMISSKLIFYKPFQHFRNIKWKRFYHIANRTSWKYFCNFSKYNIIREWVNNQQIFTTFNFLFSSEHDGRNHLIQNDQLRISNFLNCMQRSFFFIPKSKRLNLKDGKYMRKNMIYNRDRWFLVSIFKLHLYNIMC